MRKTRLKDDILTGDTDGDVAVRDESRDIGCREEDAEERGPRAQDREGRAGSKSGGGER